MSQTNRPSDLREEILQTMLGHAAKSNTDPGLAVAPGPTETVSIAHAWQMLWSRYCQLLQSEDDGASTHIEFAKAQ
jgi:hypothetical protein